MACLGALCVGAGYVLFVPALPHYQPLEPGTIYALGGLPTSGVEDRIAKSLDGGKTWLPNDVGP